jgi:hypothetical protein
MARGDHIRIARTAYYHHGIDLGDGYVIHRAASDGEGKADARVFRTTLTEFAGGGQVEICMYAAADPETTVARAESRLGELGYNLVFDNCEHFARWCVTGESSSAQVSSAVAATGIVSGGYIATAGTVSIVAVAGVVGGLSAPGVMSGLASAGRLIGGGAVAGVLVLGAVPAVAAVAATHVVMRDDVAQPRRERSARVVGRSTSAVGAVAGGVGAVAAISTAGSVAGLSAAGISSGLAALGSLVGHGMLAGAVIAAALPAVFALLLGYIAYRVASWFAPLRVATATPAL